MDLVQFEKDRDIDPNELDLAAVTQPGLFFRYAEQLVAAQVLVDKAKLRLELVETRLQMQCRSAPENFGLTKVTEHGVVAAAHAHPEYEEAHNSFLTAKEDALLLQKAVEAMEQRKRMIEVLVTLHGQEYFAGPSVKRDLGAAYKEYRQQTSDQVAASQRARTRKREKAAHD